MDDWATTVCEALRRGDLDEAQRLYVAGDPGGPYAFVSRARLASLEQAVWERDVARADLRDRDKWLSVIAIELNDDPDKTMREITDPTGLVQRILDGITALKANRH